MVSSVSLTEAEWQQVLAVLAKQPWDVANPLIFKIGNQLRIQAELSQKMNLGDTAPMSGDGASKEATP